MVRELQIGTFIQRCEFAQRHVVKFLCTVWTVCLQPAVVANLDQSPLQNGVKALFCRRNLSRRCRRRFDQVPIVQELAQGFPIAAAFQSQVKVLCDINFELAVSIMTNLRQQLHQL